MGYEKMSEKGRALAEAVELMARHDYLKMQERLIPGYILPVNLQVEIRDRFAQLDADSRAAVMALRSPDFGSPGTWLMWRDAQIKSAPQDAADLVFLEDAFGGGPNLLSRFVLESCGKFQRPWRLNHQW